KPPQASHAPDPTYTDTARRDKVEGTTVLLVVVNENGSPEVLEIVRGLGEGLDTQALATVAGWRSKPAMKNGQPVAVLINVEVNFHLQRCSFIDSPLRLGKWRKQAFSLRNPQGL